MMVGSLVAALVSALCYGVAAVMQAMAVRAASHRTAADGAAGTGVDPGLIVRMLRQGMFLASIGIDFVGFVAQLIALRRLPLVAVQAILASNLAATAAFPALLIKTRPWVREGRAAGGVGGGGGLAGSYEGGRG